MPWVLKSEAEILIISNLPRDAQHNGWSANDSQGRKLMSGSDPRTERFHQTHVTVSDIADDTAFSVKVV